MVVFAYLLLYFITAFILIRHNWFPHGEGKITKQTLPFEIASGTTDFKALTKTLKNHLDISGREDEPFQRKDSCWIYNIYRPGVNYHIVLNKKMQNIVVTTTENFTVARVSSRLHLMRHYKGGIKYYLWAFFYDMAAVAMLLFGLTGILIWFKMSKTYKSGMYYLLFGTALSIAVLVYLMI